MSAADVASRIRSGADIVRRVIQADRSRAVQAFARSIPSELARPWAFGCACGAMLLWTLLGPLFDYSGAWQMVTNFGTILVMFLMVSLRRSAHDRNNEALWLKLDELLMALQAARNEFVNLDELEDEQLNALHLELCSAVSARADDGVGQ